MSHYCSIALDIPHHLISVRLSQLLEGGGRAWNRFLSCSFSFFFPLMVALSTSTYSLELRTTS